MTPRIVFAILTFSSLLAVGAVAASQAGDVAPQDLHVATSQAHVSVTSPHDPLLRVSANHSGDAVDFLLRVDDTNGLPIVVQTWTLRPGANVRDFEVPKGDYSVTLSRVLITGMTSVDLEKCPSLAGVAQFETRVSGLSFGIKVGQRCLAAEEL